MKRQQKFDDWKPEYGWRPKPHPRQNELDRMPKRISTGGIGNGHNFGGKEGR